MADPREIDLLIRSLNGDWRSRSDFFKKYIWDNDPLRRLGRAYRQQNDFLHDCFANILRTGHSFDRNQDMAEWVESVATWTGLERQRLIDLDALGDTGRIRMCAGMEGDEPENRGRLNAYVPPRAGAADSMSSRIAALLGPTQYTLVTKRAVDNATWEEAAAAAGKPLNTIGTTLVKTIDRLTRFFGAPPPLNPDLESVFSRIGAHDAVTKRTPKSKLAGRLMAMQLDPVFYSVTPELRKLGLSVPQDVRTMVLWETARSKTPPDEALRDHLENCSYCSDVLRAMLLMQRALQSSNDADFLLCPGGFTLLNTPVHGYDKLDQHLDECSACREERTRMFGGEDAADASSQKTAMAGAVFGGQRSKALVVAAGVAAVLLLGGGYYFFSRTDTTPDAPVTSAGSTAAGTPDTPAVEMNPRYKDLAQTILVDDKRWLESVLPANQYNFSMALRQFQAGRLGEALPALAQLMETDPGALMLYSICLYQQKAASEGYRAMLRAEQMPPRNSFRCWTTLQCALMAGDLKAVEREVEHLSSDPEYGARAKAVLAQVKARK